MRRSLRILTAIIAIIVLLPILLVAGLLLALNTAPGRTQAERLIAQFTGGMVVVQGLGGRFPDALTLRHLEVHDATGPWLTADDVALDWSPTALLHRQASIQLISVASLDVARRPATSPAPAQPAAPSKPFTLPVRVTIDRLAIARATLAQPVAGLPATLTLEGSADFPSLTAGHADLTVTTPGSPARYALTAAITEERIDAHLTLAEPAGGLIAHAAALPDIGALHLDATIAGPRTALATALALEAGPLAAKATGTIDLVASRLALDATATAPAMQPAPGVSWQAIALQAHVAGPFTAPDATGHLVVTAPAVTTAALRSLTADLSGNAGQVSIDATANGLRIPGPNPALLEAAPLRLTATAQLDDPARPITFTLAHPLLAAEGTARTATPPTAHVTLHLPDLTPLGALAALAVAGHTDLTLDTTQSGGTTALDAHGTLALTTGPGPSAALIGPAAKLALSARLAGGTVTLNALSLDGAALNVAARGTNTPDGLDVTAAVTLPKLALLAPTLTGDAHLDAHVHGPANALAVDAAVTGDVGAPGVPRGPVRLDAGLTGLPGAPAGHATASGTFLGAPVDLALDATRAPDGALHAVIRKADWRSLHAEGDLTLPPGATLPQGRVALRMTRLDDLRPLAGPVSGGVTATATLTPGAVELEAEARQAGLPTAHVAHATLKARVADPLGRPVVTAALTADGIAAGATTGNARLDVTGPETALALKTTATLDSAGNRAVVAGAALLDATAKRLRLDALTVTASNATLTPETVRLLAPATVTFANGVALDRLRLGVRQAVLDVSGRVSPTLDATVTLRTPADIAAILSPAYALDGTVALDAKLSGTPAAPGGTVRLTATGLRARGGQARAFPPANLTATATLAGQAARLDARLAAGSAQLAAVGTVPLNPAGSLNLHTTGTLDLALLDPILTPGGRRAQGRISLDLVAVGSVAAPTVSGTVQLAGGEIQDFAQGARISDLAGILRAEGQTLRLVSLTGKAGPGTVAVSGTVGAFAPGLPLDLAITLRNARPLVSDTITASLDADLTLRGPAAAVQAAGRILVRGAELRIPKTLPASVVVLDVRRPGDKPRAISGPATAVGLDLTIDAPSGVFLRGRGVDAELGGSLRVRGSSTAPQVGGGLELRRGTLSIAGTTLTFSRGKVGFDGTGVSGKIDPTLDFAADSGSPAVTATLAITGYVSKPKITLSSVPTLPQDEVLAYLLFKRSAKELGPFQIAEIAAALAELTGVGGEGGLNPLDKVRKGLGLDRLSVGAGATPGSGPSLEAGRYVGNGVYIGAKQGTTGGQTQATVQIDITKGLKLESDVGTGTGGNQVRVTYQFEY